MSTQPGVLQQQPTQATLHVQLGCQVRADQLQVAQPSPHRRPKAAGRKQRTGLDLRVRTARGLPRPCRRAPAEDHPVHQGARSQALTLIGCGRVTRKWLRFGGSVW